MDNFHQTNHIRYRIRAYYKPARYNSSPTIATISIMRTPFNHFMMAMDGDYYCIKCTFNTGGLAVVVAEMVSEDGHSKRCERLC